MVNHLVQFLFLLSLSPQCATSLLTPPTLLQSSRPQKRASMTETLSDASAFMGGRAGNPQCDVNLGSPHKKACRAALRAMEWQNRRTVNKGVTTYMTPAMMFTLQMVDQIADEAQPSELATSSRLPFLYPRLALPRLYTCGKPFYSSTIPRWHISKISRRYLMLRPMVVV